MVMETIIPCVPMGSRVNRAAWEGVEDLVRRCMNGIDPKQVVHQLKMQQLQAEEWSVPEVNSCTKNLLRFYHDRLKSCKHNSKPTPYPLADEFARLVFSLHVASSVIETYFSKTKYIKSLHRASMRDSLSTATLHVQQLRSYMDPDVVETISTLDIDLTAALSTIEHDVERLREKYLDAEVSKNFHDEVLRQVRPYKGRCTDVFYSRTEGQYLFHVVYDSDSDDEDYELWEIAKYST